MLDTKKITRDVEHDADHAMHGDADALKKLRNELHALHSDQLRTLAPALETALGAGMVNLFGGVRVDHDPHGEVSSITFVPSISDRASGSHAISTDLSLNNFIDDSEKLFSKLDTNHNGTISLEELGAATANKQLSPHEASLLSALSALVQGSDGVEFPSGITMHDLEQMRSNWSRYAPLTKAVRDGEASIANGKSLYGSLGITPDAIQQGSLGDCVLESSLVSLAAKHPEKIKEMIKDNKNGTYTVTFAPGHAFTVSAPTNGELAVANRSGQNGMWPIIIEKAYSQYMLQRNPGELNEHILGIDGLNIADTLSHLTNRPAEALTDLRTSARPVADFLSRHLSKNDPVIAGTREYLDGDTPDGFPGGHAFAALGFDPTGANGGTVTLRNPWNGKPGTPAGQWKISLWAFRANFLMVSSADMDGRPITH